MVVYNKSFYGFREIKDESVQFIFADPPYNISVESNFKNEEIGYTPDKGEWDRISKKEEIQNAKQLIVGALRILKQDGTIAISGTYGSLVPYFLYLNKYGFVFKHHLIWHKINPAPCVHRKTLTLSNEIILIYSKNKSNKFNYEVSKLYNEGKQLHDVWNIPVTKKELGVTRKPKELIRRLVSIYSDEGDLNCDPVLGSGQTYEICEELNTDFVGYEIDRERCIGLKNKGLNVIL
jgi:site-specific DNA-methyltransferase (adenine-specific)